MLVMLAYKWTNILSGNVPECFAILLSNARQLTIIGLTKDMSK